MNTNPITQEDLLPVQEQPHMDTNAIEQRQDVQPVQNEYLLLVEEHHMLLLSNILVGVKYLPVQGMDIQENGSLQLLVTPKRQEIPVVDVEPCHETPVQDDPLDLLLVQDDPLDGSLEPLNG